jgi:hypothetical protein
VAEPYRVQLSRAKGWRMPDGAIKVDRSTRWGNPFEPGRRVIAPGAYGSLASPYHGCQASGTYGSGPRKYEIRKVRGRAEAVALFASYVRRDPSGWPPGEIFWGLGGSPLACWCPLDEPCHADILLAVANGRRLPEDVESAARAQLEERRG